MIGRSEQIAAFRALVEGSRIAVVNTAREAAAAGLSIVPVRSGEPVVTLFYRRDQVARVAADGKLWHASNTSRALPCLPSACFAAVANHLSRSHTDPRS